MADVIKVKVRVKTHVHLAGKEHTAADPARFMAGQVVEIDEETAKASPWAFEPVDPAVEQRWADEKKKEAPAA
jgi:hypothetical protein